MMVRATAKRKPLEPQARHTRHLPPSTKHENQVARCVLRVTLFATRGLGIVPSPTTDNPTPQETTNQDAPEVGPDGAGVYFPGSSLLADEVRVEKVQLKFDWSGEG